MPQQTKRIYRISLVTALALAIAYGMQIPMPFIAPLFAFLLALKSEQAIGLKGLVGLLLVITITLGSGLLLIGFLDSYPLTGLLLVALGIYVSAHMLVNLGKALVGTFFMVGFTMISSVGTLSFAVALTIVDAILMAVLIAIVCQWLVFPFFAIPAAAQPSENQTQPPTQAEQENQSGNVALQTTAIVFPFGQAGWHRRVEP